MYKTILEKVNSISEEIIANRRAFHMIPETAWNEKLTSDKIAMMLDQMGYIVWEGEDVAGHDTGVIAELDCGEGPVIALRFDIDALPNAETDSAEHLPNKEGFASDNSCMHACGHDGHIAIGLGCARVLLELEGELEGKIRLIFQPAEEGCRGALPLTEKGWLNDVDYFMAGHIVPRAYVESDDVDKAISDKWDVVPVSGSYATSKINARFIGKAAHAATPENGISVMPAIAAAIEGLTNAKRPEGGKTILNIGTISAGESRNIVAGNGLMELEVRGESTKLNWELHDTVVEIIKEKAEQFGCKAEIEVVGSAPSLASSKSFCEMSANLINTEYERIICEAEESVIFRASEDASVMIARVKEYGGKAAYFLLPTDTKASLHKPDYDFDEAILGKAVAFYCANVYNLIGMK